PQRHRKYHSAKQNDSFTFHSTLAWVKMRRGGKIPPLANWPALFAPLASRSALGGLRGRIAYAQPKVILDDGAAGAQPHPGRRGGLLACRSGAIAAQRHRVHVALGGLHAVLGAVILRRPRHLLIQLPLAVVVEPEHTDVHIEVLSRMNNVLRDACSV